MQEAETGAAKKVFDLDLPELGPYNLTFTRSGRHMLLGGRKGHLALMEWQQRHLVCEVQVGDTSRLCPGTIFCEISRQLGGAMQAKRSEQFAALALFSSSNPTVLRTAFRLITVYTLLWGAGSRNHQGCGNPTQRAVLCSSPEEIRVHL